MGRAEVVGALQDLLLREAGMDPTSLGYEAIVRGRSRSGGRSAAIPDARPALVGGQAGEGGAISCPDLSVTQIGATSTTGLDSFF